MKYRHGKVKRDAYKKSKVWKLGPHYFYCDGDMILRLCFLRTRNTTYYCQLSWQSDKL